MNDMIAIFVYIQNHDSFKVTVIENLYSVNAASFIGE